MSISIVVARYNENIDWTHQFSNVIVYNKGEPIQEETITLDNVGRETHTYYKHIYDNYDNLSDYTIFLQGHPFDHSPNIITRLHTILNTTDLNTDFEFLSETILDCNLSGCKYHPGLPLIETYKGIFNTGKTDLRFTFGAGAQFIVSKKQILKRSKEFYLNIINMLDKKTHPIEAWVIERFHGLIFMD